MIFLKPRIGGFGLIKAFPMNQEVNVLALVKGKERYVFMYNGKNRDAVLESFSRYASDSELSFSWYDAALLTQRVRREQRQAEIAAARAANGNEPNSEKQSANEIRSRRNAFKNVGADFFDELED